MSDSILSKPAADFLHVASLGGRMLVYGFEPDLPAAHERAAHARAAFQEFSDQVFIARVEMEVASPRGLSFVAGWVREGDHWSPASPPRVQLALRELVLEAEPER